MDMCFKQSNLKAMIRPQKGFNSGKVEDILKEKLKNGVIDVSLIFTVIQNMVHTMKKLNITIAWEFASYLEAQHKKTVLYKTRTDEAQTRTDFLFQQSNVLYDAILKEEALQKIEAFCHLERLLNEQCMMTEVGIRIPISSK